LYLIICNKLFQKIFRVLGSILTTLFPWERVAASKEATEPRVTSG